MADFEASDVAVKQIRCLRCHGERIKEVVDEVESLVSTLRNAHMLLNNHSNLSEDYEVLLRRVASHAEDALETFVVGTTAMLQKKQGRFIKRFSRKFFPALHDRFVLTNIKADVGKFHPRIIHMFVNLLMDKINSETLVASQGQRCLRLAYPRGIEDQYFVGMDDELNTLVSRIVENKTRVISIWGVTGSGKTTITAKIFKQLVKKKSFEAFAWVCLSQVSQINIVLINILSQLSPRQPIEDSTSKKVEALIEQLKEVQKKYDCLIVLDDVRNMDQWQEVSAALETEGACSVILLTTREQSIANYNVGFAHELRLLNEDEAWDLLKKHAFPRKDGPGALRGLLV